MTAKQRSAQTRSDYSEQTGLRNQVGVPDPEHTSYLTMWWFFFPLALTFSLITFTHTIVNSALGKLPRPEAAIAAYAVARSVMHLAQNPTMMIRQVVTSLVTDDASYVLVRRVIYKLMFILAGFLAILSWTPAGATILQSFMGLEGESLRQGILSLRVFTLFPFISVNRNLGQGLAILARANHIVPFATGMRLLSLVVILQIFIRWQPFPGAVMGAIAFTITMVVEAAMLFWAGKPARRRLRQRKPDPGKALTTPDVLRFYVPLMGTTLAAALTIPLVQAGVSRTADAEIQLASFAVTMALSMVITSPANMIHQSSIAFIKEGQPDTHKRVMRFALFVGIFLSITTAVIAFTPFSDRFLAGGGATAQMMDTSRRALQILVLMPIVRSWREHCWGVLMLKRLTKSITQGKTISIVSTVSIMIIGIVLGARQTALMGAWSLVIGEAIEGLYLQKIVSRSIAEEQTKTLTPTT